MLPRYSHRLILDKVAYGGAFASILMAACANDPGNQSSDHPEKESTLTDAQRSAQGKRGSVAPSQLQFGFGDHQQETQEAIHEETPPPSPSDLRSMAVPLKE